MSIALWIIGGIVVETATVIGSLVIQGSTIFTTYKKLSGKGYKISREYLDKLGRIQKNVEDAPNSDEVKNKMSSEAKNLLAESIGVAPFKFICLLLPVINLIYSKAKSSKIANTWVQEAIENEWAIPMNESEKDFYNSSESNFEKLLFGGIVSLENDDEITLEFELTPLDYSLNEIEKLNEACSESTYMVGQTSDKNIAIIGIPSDVSKNHIKYISFKDSILIREPYTELNKDEAQNKTFTVYSYFDLKGYPQVENIIQEIKKSRIDDAIRMNSEPLEVHNVFEDEISPVETEEVLHEKQASQLVKTIHTKKDKR